MLLLSAAMAKSSGSSVGKSIRLEFKRPGFESQLDLKFLGCCVLIYMHTLCVCIFCIGSLNCAAFVAGVIEGFLNGTHFVSHCVCVCTRGMYVCVC